MTSPEHPPSLPDRIESEEQLDELLTRPSSALVEFIRTLPSPLVILGAGGKMGPSLAVLSKRAAAEAGHSLEVIAISRFTDAAAAAWLNERGVRTVAGDLLDDSFCQRLPEAVAVIYLVGLKFGTAKNPAATWAMNTLVPASVVERYPKARIVGLSTGNVYPLTEIHRGGADETTPLTPLGEYANAAVGRERIFEFCSQRHSTRVTLLRLFYAVDGRYGVLVDIARKVHRGEPIELTNGYFNCIWQGDANELTLRSLALASSPPAVRNLCLPEVFSLRSIATRFGELLGRPPQFIGTEAGTALLGNSSRLCNELGSPGIKVETMLRWIAHWVKRGGRHLGKPTHFEVRDGNY